MRIQVKNHFNKINLAQFYYPFTTQRGLGLVEVLVASALLAITMLGLATMLSETFKSQRTVQAKDANRELAETIRALLSNKDICKASFGGGNPSGNGFSKTKIIDTAVPPNIKFNINTEYIDKLVVISNFQVKNYTADNAAAPEIGKAMLEIRMKKTGETIGSQSMVVSLVLQVRRNAGGNITECFSIGGAEWLWRMSPMNMANIFYNGGNVGIGTTNPNSKLAVAGDIKVGNSASLCTATNEGAMRYNTVLKVVQFCNGTSWHTILNNKKGFRVCLQFLDDGGGSQAGTIQCTSCLSIDGTGNDAWSAFATDANGFDPDGARIKLESCNI